MACHSGICDFIIIIHHVDVRKVIFRSMSR